MQEWAERLYKSRAWKTCRDEYFRQAGGLCERCRKRGIISPGEIVHHKVHLTPVNVCDPNISLNFRNLELLCRECHGKEHQKIRRRYKFDEVGRVLVAPYEE